METFYLEFKVTPTSDNEYYDLVEGAFAHCWLLENESQSAYSKSFYFVSKYGWQIEKLETPPMIVTSNHFLEKDIGLEHYDKAQDEGIAIAYISWAKDKKTTAGPLILKPTVSFNLSGFLEKQKQLAKHGKCLHYYGGYRCDDIISAHSIQKKQLLSAIADNGHVYRISSNFTSLKKNKGNLNYEKIGINKVSTFRGFCNKHDNELFEPIDNLPLLPTDKQVFLYAYRSLCRELIVKENAFNLLERQLSDYHEHTNATIKILTDMRDGTAFGLDNLGDHKLAYDTSLRKESYHDIRYVLLISKQKPLMAFSGLLYPEFDFMGRQLQNLGNIENKLDLITFCSTVMRDGWGFLFAWHRSSSNVCVELMRSLATMAHDNNDVGDMLFRMVMSNCENIAISPKWWEQLPVSHKEEVVSRANSMANIFSMNKPTYLMEGLEKIACWDFESVIANMD